MANRPIKYRRQGDYYNYQIVNDEIKNLEQNYQHKGFLLDFITASSSGMTPHYQEAYALVESKECRKIEKILATDVVFID